MRILLLALLASAPLISASPAKRATTLIPKTVFDSAANLEEYSSNNYPWGDSHNGRARMNKAHAVITSPGVLTITAQHVTGQAPVTSGGKKIPINYLSGAINAKQHITVTKGGGLVFSASFKAPVAKGVCRPYHSFDIKKIRLKETLMFTCVRLGPPSGSRPFQAGPRDRHGRMER
jgi:hypothetical protein